MVRVHRNLPEKREGHGKQIMTKKIEDIEVSLQLCKEMDSPSVVISVSTIEKHFPAPRHPANPNIPSYDLGALKEWAKEKGWSITFATTGTKTDRRMVPAIRFSPLDKINSIPDSTTKPASNNADEKHNPRFRISLKGIVEGVIIALLVVWIIWLINHYFHLDLKL